MASSSLSSLILNFASIYSLYTNCITFSMGLIGNALNILVFTQLKCFRNNRCALYITVESISNFTNQIFSLIFTMAPSIYGQIAIDNSLSWCRIRYIITQTTALIAYSMICFAACYQFVSTNYRFNFRQICTPRLSKYFVFLSICIWFFHSLIFGCFVGIQPSLGCVILNQILIQYSTFFFYPVLMSFLPIGIASSFSLLAFRNVRRIIRRQMPVERRRFDRQITAMVLLRVVFFVLLILPNRSYRIYAINTTIDKTNLLQYAIVQLIQAIFASFVDLNYAICFYLFIISSSRYRRQVKYVLTKKCWRQWKNWCYCKKNQIHPENMVTESNIEIE